MNEGHIKKIQSRGYWRVHFQPLVFEERLKTLGECLENVARSSVSLRGWDYPHVPQRRDESSDIEPGDKYYSAWVDWSAHIEFWRMFQSGQFLHYLALKEDWVDRDNWLDEDDAKIRPMTALGLIRLIYHFTEVYLFLSRLSRHGIYKEGAKVSISLNNAQGRKLWIEDRRRGPFLGVYKASAEKLEFTKKYSRDSIEGKPKDLALEGIVYIVDRFGWHNPGIESIKRDQDNLLAGQLS